MGFVSPAKLAYGVVAHYFDGKAATTPALSSPDLRPALKVINERANHIEFLPRHGLAELFSYRSNETVLTTDPH